MGFHPRWRLVATAVAHQGEWEGAGRIVFVDAGAALLHPYQFDDLFRRDVMCHGDEDLAALPIFWMPTSEEKGPEDYAFGVDLQACARAMSSVRSTFINMTTNKAKAGEVLLNAYQRWSLFDAWSARFCVIVHDFNLGNDFLDGCGRSWTEKVQSIESPLLHFSFCVNGTRLWPP